MREWKQIKEYSDILFEQHGRVARITINRPEVYNAFRPQTVMEMLDAVAYTREAQNVGVLSSPVPATRHSAPAAISA